MASDAGEFTHEEIWDDSALVNSWNQALDEYKKYHSVHAKGGSVDDILAQQPAAQPPAGARETGQDGVVSGVAAEDEVVAVEGAVNHETLPRGHTAPQMQFDSGTALGGAGQTAGEGVAFGGPQLLLSNVEDDELKKLLMSWYWAGYYTATYQAKQKQSLQNGQE